MSSGDEASLTLPDGRVVEYFDGGDPSGGQSFSARNSSHADHGEVVAPAALAAGVRLISVSRPGYGGSTAIADRPTLSAAARDTAALATLLGA